MSPNTSCAAFRGRLRALAIGTLSEVDERAVQAHVDACPDCAAALEAEIRALSVLDLYPDAEPSRDLTAAMMMQVQEKPARRTKRSRQSIAMQYAAAAFAILILAGALLPALSRSREAARRESSANNLKQIGLVLKMYSNESSGGLLPRISPYEGRWMMDLQAIAPEYLSDLNVFTDPNSKEQPTNRRTFDDFQVEDIFDWQAMTKLASHNYTYIGWMVDDEDDLAAVIATMARDEDVVRGERDVTRGREPIHRLREGIERFMITDINNPGASGTQQSAIPVMFETMDPDNPRVGYYVLYMDGHVEYVLYGEKFPITERVARMLAGAK